MKVARKNCKIYLVLLSICLVGNIIAFWIPMARAGFEEDFDRASDWSRYRGDVGYKNARLIQNVTSVLHRENLAILKELDALKAEVSKIRQLIEKM